MRASNVLRASVGLYVFASLAFPQAGAADEVVLTPVADATMIERAPDNSSGGARFFNAGTTQAGTRNRALLQFDLTSQIPANATITSATLELRVVREPSCGFEASAFGLYRVLRPWGEGVNVPTDNPGGLGAPALPNDATWNSPFAGTSQSWAAPGGASGIDYSLTLSSSAILYGVGESPYQFESTLDTAADLQLWLNHPGTNFGWMLISQSEDTPFTARRFASREDPFGGGPTLTVDFEIVPEPSALAFWGLGLIGLALVRRIHRAAPKTGTDK
jgi:hypothetical protein